MHCRGAHAVQNLVTYLLGLGFLLGCQAYLSLQWCHNECDGVSNHRRLGCLLNRLFRRRSQKTPKHRVTGFCEGNSPVKKGPVSRKMLPLNDVIMSGGDWHITRKLRQYHHCWWHGRARRYWLREMLIFITFSWKWISATCDAFCGGNAIKYGCFPFS